MEAPKTRYSTHLAAFNGELGKLNEAEADTVRGAFEKGCAAGRPVAFVAALPADLAAAGQDLVERTAEEVEYRGEQWRRLSLVATLREYLPALKPKPAAAKPASKPAATPATSNATTPAASAK